MTFTTSTMMTFMNELTNITGGDFRFDDDSGRVCHSLSLIATTAEPTEEPEKGKGGKGKGGKGKGKK